MDPMTLMQLFAHLRQQQGQGMGQMPPMGQLPPMQGQMPPQGQPQGQLPTMTPPQGGMGGQSMGGDQQDHRHGGGFSPWMMLSPLGGLFAHSPKTAMSLMSPAFGMANLFGAFK